MLLARRPNKLALAGILLSLVCSETNPIFSKILFAEGWTPLGMYFLSMLFVCIFLAVHEFMIFENGGKWKIDCRDIWGIVLTTLTGGILAPLLFLYGLKLVLASEAVLITSLSPLFIVIFAVLLLKESFTPNLIIGAVFLLAGIIVLLWNDILHSSLSMGVPFLIGSSIIGALTTTFHKKFVKHRHLDSIVLIRALAGLVVVGIAILLVEPNTFSMLKNPPSVWMILGLSVVSFIFPYFLYYRALAKISTLDAGLVVAASPGIGVLMASAFLGEQITSMQFISLGLMAFGILFINVPLTKLRIMPSRPMEMGPLRR